jgi:hypothetical protein
MQASIRLRHRVVTVEVAEGVKEILPANPKRARALMFNSAVAGSTVYVGHSMDEDGNELSDTNGWPLHEDRIVTYNPNNDSHYFKFLANVLELFTQDAVYARAYSATGVIRIIEELM